MKKFSLLVVVLLVVGLNVKSQEKIATNTYLYGNLRNSIKGNILVWYGIDDPKGEKKALKSFVSHGYRAESWNKFFIPGQSITNDEINKVIERNNIETIIFIKKTNSSSYTQGTATTILDSYTYATSYGVVGSVSIDFEIFSKDNGFTKPVAVVKSTANNGWGAAGSERGLVIKIVDRILSKAKKY